MPAPYIHRPPLRHARNTYRAFPLSAPGGFNTFFVPPTFGNTATITVSAWMRAVTWSGSDNVGIIGFCQGSGARFVLASRSTSGVLRFEAANSGGTGVLDLNIASIPVNSWYHFLSSIDVNAGTFQCYVTDSDYSANVTTTTLATSETINVAGNGCRIFSRASVSTWGGYIADLYINCSTALDISVAATREKFIKNGKPVYLGADGSYPTGSKPAYFFTRQGEANWPRSVGTVTGNWAINNDFGDFLEAPNSPSD